MKKTKVKLFQSLLDISAQEYGMAEGIVKIALANNISITDELIAGAELNIPDFENANKKVLKYYEENKIIPATADTQSLLMDEPECDGTEFTDEFNYEYNTCLNSEDEGFFGNEFSNEFLT